MSDIATIWVNDPEYAGDYSLTLLGDLETDDGLTTAVLLSLFTDRRDEDDRDLADQRTSRRGWWGEKFGPTNDRWGSYIWKLDRRKLAGTDGAGATTVTTLADAKLYAEQALAWMIEDGVAERVDVETYIPKRNMIAWQIDIYRRDGGTYSEKFGLLWEAQVAV